MAAHPNGEFQYIEFASHNLARIKTFYTVAFGWQFTDYGSDYTAFAGENVDGGFYKGEPRSGSILPILYVSDLVSSRERVSAAGGEIVKDIFSFPGGHRFHFRDPDGNEIAVWSEGIV